MVTAGDSVNNWEFFKQQWTDYEVATGLEEQHPKVRIATLRSVMGKECLQILLNLKLAEEERTDCMECYFKPKRNIVYERYMFNTCMQNVAEPIVRYVNRLRKQAATCKFRTLTDELIRDRLVLVIRHESTKLRLLKEDKLDFNKALHICRSNEIASRQLKAMSSDSNKAMNKEEIRVVRERKSKSPQKSRSTKQIQRKDMLQL